MDKIDDSNSSLRVVQVQLKNFRCFSKITVNFDTMVSVIEGSNGIGKTSFLEALHFGCYLRSFRTYSPKELIRFGQDSFLIHISTHDAHNLSRDIQIGFADGKKLVKIDQLLIASYKELMDYYRLISMTEDDLILVKGSPHVRRTFIDHALMIAEPLFLGSARQYKQVLDQRNFLLEQNTYQHDEYVVWTEQLWKNTKKIQELRIHYVTLLEQKINTLIKDYFDDIFSLRLEYQARNRNLYDDFTMFMNNVKHLELDEQRYKRSLFGAHLDDISIHFQEKKSKYYASRGQQKLIVFLIKIAQIQLLTCQRGPVLFVLDDFITDFDAFHMEKISNILYSLKTQIIITTPYLTPNLERYLQSAEAQRIKLTD